MSTNYQLAFYGKVIVCVCCCRSDENRLNFKILNVMFIERLQAISSKFSSPYLDVRCKALKNLLFKIEHGLLTSAQENSVGWDSLVATIILGIKCSLATFEQVHQEDPQIIIEYFESISIVINWMSVARKENKLNELQTSKMREVFDELNVIMSKNNLNDKIREILTAVSFCFIHMDSWSSSFFQCIEKNCHNTDIFFRNNDVQISSERKNKFSVHEINNDNAKTVVDERRISHSVHTILKSPLTTNGWKLPSVTLTESDKTYIFNCEVSLELIKNFLYKKVFAGEVQS